MIRLPTTRWKRYCITIPLTLLAAYVVVCAIAVLAEDSLVFLPSPASAYWAEPPAAWHAEEIGLTLPDGTPTHAWWLPNIDSTAGVALFAHGNGGNDSHVPGIGKRLRDELGVSVLLFDYPGYGKSGGRPSEAGCYAAGDAAYAWLTREKGVPANRVLIVGESLGGGPAIELATRQEHRALVLLRTFSNLPDTAADRFPFLPCGLLMRNRFDNVAKAPRLTRPVFQVHGTADEVIPFALGEKLHAVLPEPKFFLRVEGMSHNVKLPETFADELRGFLAKHAP